MKKYKSLGELIKDYRLYNKMSKVKLAKMLNVDVRSITRWESEEKLIDPSIVEDVARKLFIPFQVIHNLNSKHPVPVYYNISNRTFALEFILTQLPSVFFKYEMQNFKIETFPIIEDEDFEFLSSIQILNNNSNLINKNILRAAAKNLPELNFILKDQQGFYAGHVSMIHLKYSTYLKIRDKKMLESQIAFEDLETVINNEKLNVFYFYSIYADSLPNSFYLLHKILLFFKKRKLKKYIIAGISYREGKVKLLEEIGFKKVWVDRSYGEKEIMATFLEGDFEKFLED
jgi:transcriptional regulator with XRE-family HTH domain